MAAVRLARVHPVPSVASVPPSDDEGPASEGLAASDATIAPIEPEPAPELPPIPLVGPEPLDALPALPEEPEPAGLPEEPVPGFVEAELHARAEEADKSRIARRNLLKSRAITRLLGTPMARPPTENAAVRKI